MRFKWLTLLHDLTLCYFVLAGSHSNLIAVYVFAGIVIAMAVVLICKEFLWMKINKLAYFYSFQNYNELLIYSLSIVFVFVFKNDCGCPEKWQWQLGIFVIFMAWIKMIFTFSTIPRTGLYIIMFKKIFLTFSKLIFFALLLVTAFSLLLFMMFHNPFANVRNIISLT